MIFAVLLTILMPLGSVAEDAPLDVAMSPWDDVKVPAGAPVGKSLSGLALQVKASTPTIFQDRFELLSSDPDEGCEVPSEMLPTGPLEVTEFSFTEAPLDGNSFDLSFSSVDRLFVRNGAQLVSIDINGNVTTAPTSRALPDTLGLRFSSNGNLLVAAFQNGQILNISSDGTVSTYWQQGLVIPYGLFPSPDGSLFLTDFQAPLVGYVPPGAGQIVTLVQGAEFANSASGVVLDINRQIAFYVSYNLGRLFSIDVSSLEHIGKPQILYDLQADESGVRLSGLALDSCGHLYAVDQNQGGPGALYRFELDAPGTAVASVTKLATDFPNGISNCVFGEGPSWESFQTTLFCVGLAGTIHTVDVGVQGAPTAISVR